MDSLQIIIAEQKNLKDVRTITQETIKTVYPKYYPKGAVQFFIKHHCDEHILKDIWDNNVYLLQNGSQFLATVTINNNNINRLFVLPEHQHKGYGKYLLDFAEEKIAEKYDSVIIDASFPAKKIYKRRGYIEMAYNIIETSDGDYLCYDVMTKNFKIMQ